ncbi:YoaK family protein [Cupriavidus plantarum]|uniref:YoaK family protein n=1 Tax=Cupriavidus plantarum TaxID=942865 RepID=UPI000E2411C1|nr:YoaK family protein [Cupriavidus plantarum]REE94092.1 uncharacterized membrane protein YoaK (UPF0700 family) [Cupriavidus plantarum]
MSPTSQPPSPQYHVPAFAFVAGFIDVIGFIALAGLFTAHVTGNLIMIGVASVGQAESLALKVLALPTFVVAVALVRITEKRLVGRQRHAVAMLVAIECLLLASFAIAGIALTGKSGTAAVWLGTVTGLLAVTAMAVQNALSRTALVDLGPTTIMTGNTTQVVIDLVDLLSAAPAERAPIRARLAKMVPGVLAFAVGAILGARLYLWVGYWAAWVPVVVLATLSGARVRATAPVNTAV